MMHGVTHEPFRVVRQPSAKASQTILTLKGAMTSASAAAFVEAIAAVASPQLILDMTEVPFVDSMAVGSLVRAFVSCHKTGRKLALVGLGHRVKNVMHLTGIGPLFDVYATVPEAEAALA
jgi:anti-sigma B factor antagonist